MHGSLVERSHLVDSQSVPDDSASRSSDASSIKDAVLWCHLDDYAAGGDDLQLGGAEVHVGSVEAAWAEESQSHSGTGADEGWEGLAVSSEDVAALAGVAARQPAKVEDEVGVLVQDGEAVGSGVSDGELGSAGESWCCHGGRGGSGLTDVWLWSSEDWGGQDGGGDEVGELHFDDCVGDCLVVWFVESRLDCVLSD